MTHILFFNVEFTVSCSKIMFQTQWIINGGNRHDLGHSRVIF